MALIKCKMCGGDLKITEGLTVAECEYCGSRQTIPSADNEKKMTLFTRAARLLRGCEFDKAAGLFESIVADFPEEAEAYWGLVLCKYGIEYVDDPATGKKVPTCHRSSFDSVLDDANFEQACENTDAVARRVYRDEARQIEELRKRIIEVSGREEPYDVFISYKETDENGQRTLDSVIAQDIYDELSGKGYRVFFSRISLEDKLGVEYEPYIFAALNSAKVMLVIGTDFENFDAVWVKNEWSRFLKLIEAGQKKVLIPVFKNIDAYDMPKEFNKLSAQDMGKVGAMQDLVRGVEKIIPITKNTFDTTHERSTTVNSAGDKIASLLDRGKMALEDSDWDKATGFFEEVLNNNSKNSHAYLGKVLAEEKCSNADALILLLDQIGEVEFETLKLSSNQNHILDMANCYHVEGYLSKSEVITLYNYDLSYTSKVRPFEEILESKKKWFEYNKNFARAEQFASSELATLIEYIKNSVLGRCNTMLAEEKEHEKETKEKLCSAYEKHIEKIDEEVKKLNAKAVSKRDADYDVWTANIEIESVPAHLLNTATKLDGLNGYKDSSIFAKKARDKAAVEQAKLDAAIEIANLKKAKTKKLSILAAIAIVIVATAFFTVTEIVIPANDYKAAEALVDAGKYEEAIAAFETLKGYKDSEERYQELSEHVAREKAEAEIKKHNPNSFISAGFYHTVGLKSDGTVISTEYTGIFSGSRCDVYGWRDIVSISAGENLTLGLKSDGTVVAAGESDYLTQILSWQDIISISTWNYHAVGLRSDGTVVVAGKNGVNDDRCNVDDWRDIVAISAGQWFTVGLKSDGTVVAVGSKEDGRCDVSEWTDIVAISTGSSHTVGLKSDGTVVAVGNNKHGACNVGEWTDIVAISAGNMHTVGLKSDGTVVATTHTGTFYNGWCDVGEWTDIVAISAGRDHTVGLKSDGTVVATKYIGDYYCGQCDVSDWSDIKLPEKEVGV
ncbi:MAG: TIR domain-containing protein [Oscillospiraceae bacterium]|nr:TIR domain-containing protein [Oscillospiraceae bacterium]